MSEAEKRKFDDAVNLLSTRQKDVDAQNQRQLAVYNELPVIRVKARNEFAAIEYADDEEAEGLAKEIYLREGGKVMFTRNIWASKGISSL
jgi:hypothetical protein